MNRAPADAGTNIAVVGAGHAGLCVVAALRRRGLGAVVFDDAMRLGDVWRARYDGLVLNTERDASLIPGIEPAAGMRRWPRRDRWADYVQSAGRQLAPDRRQVRVEAVEAVGDRWALRTRPRVDEGTDFDVVILATGRARVPLLPCWNEPPAGRVRILHSSEFRNAADHRGQRVVVVGSGNSGAEIAHILTAGGVDVTWSIRTRPVWARRELFGTDLTALAARGKSLPDRVVDIGARLAQPVLFGRLRPYGLGPPERRLSQVQQASGATLDSGVIDDVKSGRVRLIGDIEAITETGVRSRDGSTVDCDTVIAATGFAPGLDGLLPGECLDNGWPRVGDAPFEQAPGLFTAGLNPATLTAFHPDFVSEAESIADAVLRRRQV